MTAPIPTPCRIVEYRLTKEQAQAANRRRQDARRHDEARRFNAESQGYRGAVSATSYQAHVGNDHVEGDTLPMLIVRAWGSTPTSSVNGQVFLDGNDTLWVTSVAVGDGPGTFSWPVR